MLAEFHRKIPKIRLVRADSVNELGGESQCRETGPEGEGFENVG